MITIILLVLAAMLNSAMDMNLNMYDTSVFSKLNPDIFNPTISWKNKFKNGDRTQGPKFFGSTTFFVCFTDSWHFLKMLFINTIFLIISINVHILSWYYELLICNVIWGICFEIVKRILTKKS